MAQVPEMARRHSLAASFHYRLNVSRHLHQLNRTPLFADVRRDHLIGCAWLEVGQPSGLFVVMAGKQLVLDPSAPTAPPIAAVLDWLQQRGR